MGECTDSLAGGEMGGRMLNPNSKIADQIIARKLPGWRAVKAQQDQGNMGSFSLAAQRDRIAGGKVIVGGKVVGAQG
jgi:hypothetical protein